jgi:NitT/TauT family transport system permease protein
VIREPISRRRQVILAAASVLVLLIGYSVLSHNQHVANPHDTTIPGWSQMAAGFWKSLTPNTRSGEIWLLEDAWATGTRLFMGMLCGTVGAILLGLLMGCSKQAEAFFLPPLSLLAKVPPTAAMAVFFVMVGMDTRMYVAMIAFGVLPVMAQSVYLAALDVPEELLYKAYTLGASDAEVVTDVVIPYVMPRLLDSLRLQIGPAMVYLIAAEMLVGDVGFGYRIRLQQRLLNMSLVYPYLVALAGFGFGVDSLLGRLQKKLCPWAVD